jgi:hypothetical protein
LFFFQQEVAPFAIFCLCSISPLKPSFAKSIFKNRESDALPWDIAHNILQHEFLARIQQQKSKHEECNTMHALDELPPSAQ